MMMTKIMFYLILIIDNVDILKLPIKELRENIGFVTQETFLFSDTLRENITLSLKNPENEVVNKIIEFVQLDEEINNFKDGLDSVLGERGINLSGGQKQRAALARAIIKKPKILILDDPFSSIDTKTEEIILNNLNTIIKNQTTIIISHRISTIKNCDQIIVLENGEITQKGTHLELLKQGGTYKSIFDKQLLQEQINNQ